MTSDKIVADRYKKKVSDYCAGTDPYTIIPDKGQLPTNVSYMEVDRYLIHNLSSYSNQSYKSYKSLDAFRFYKAGWLQEIGSNKTSVRWIVSGRVKHSMRINLPPLHAWLATDFEGI